MRTLPLLALAAALTSGCAGPQQAEERQFELDQAGQQNRCNRAARERCAGVEDVDACMEREAGACDEAVGNENSPSPVNPVPPSLRDEAPLAQPGDAY
ncbi:MAG TPA: hypothetical protein VMW35_08760 [Myxococcota bacterium]|nr:hypothetical protein [Myxococcota bacterium]